jgi:phosphate transport system substrate-binding protein
MKSRTARASRLTVLLPACLILAACGQVGGPVTLKGAGATAPNLVYSKWVTEFKKTDGSVDLQYQATGSGDGIRQLEEGAVDFAATDLPLEDAEAQKLKVKPFYFPTLTGAIVPVSNLPGVSNELQFSGETLAGIFSGKIKTWNDAAVAKENAAATLPANPIVVVHRADSSGSTWAFTEFLSQTSPAWKSSMGTGGVVKWPVGEAVSGSEGVADKVKGTPYAIGYVELNYAIQKKLPYGPVRNSSGRYLKPDLPAQNAAVRSKPEIEKDFRVTVINPPAAAAYPITTITWLVVPSEFMEEAKMKAMKRFLRFAYSSGLDIAMPMDYGILPPEVLGPLKDQIEKIK